MTERPVGGVRIRAVHSDEDLATLAALSNAVTSDDPTSLDEMRWTDRTYPGSRRVLAEIDDRVVGAATVGRIYMYPPEFDALWATIAVLPDERRRGVGTALLDAVSDHARVAGKAHLHLRTSDARPQGAAFLTHHGFVGHERDKIVRLDLTNHTAPEVHVPPGIELTTLAERPDLVPGVHAVALETFADIPTGEEPIAVGDLAEFRARDVDRPKIPHEAFFVAVDGRMGTVVGYASLILLPGSTTVAWHDMTAVRRVWRGRGIAGALKRATIAWAIGHGLTTLETGNDEQNAPMRAVNARLGYRPGPDEVRCAARSVRSGHDALVTETPSPPATPLPPDPEAYDSPRAVRAREKGLAAPYIAGGDDPDPANALAEERRYGKLLVGMAVAIVASGFVIGTIIALFRPA